MLSYASRTPWKDPLPRNKLAEESGAKLQLYRQDGTPAFTNESLGLLVTLQPTIPAFPAEEL